MRSLHGHQSAILDALPDAPPGLPATGVRDILELRCSRPASPSTIRRGLHALRRSGMVRVRRQKGCSARWWRA